MNGSQGQEEEKQPEPIQAVYSTPDVNSRIELHAGPMTFRFDKDTLVGDGRLFYAWLPSPALRFEMFTDKQLPRDLRLAFKLPNAETTEIEVHSLRRTVPVVGVGSGHVAGSQLRISGTINGEVVTGVQTALSSLLFHLPNIPAFGLSPDGFAHQTDNFVVAWQRVILRSDRWIVTLDPVSNEDDLIRKMKATRGYPITRVGRLERADGKTFTLKAARQALEIVEHALSFALEGWVAPMLLVGIGRNGQRKCEAWSSRHVSPYQAHLGWFDFHHPGSLSELFAALDKQWKGDVLREPLKDAIYWYIEIHRRPMHIETGIMLAQIALEMLSWLILIECNAVVSEKGFSDLPAADKLKLLLSTCSIPIKPPAELSSLSKLAKAENWQGPDVLVQIRNSIVHRNKKKREKSGKKLLSSEILHDASRLACWYLELVILRQLEYQGDYSNRLKQRWVGQVEPVPWVTNRDAKS